MTLAQDKLVSALITTIAVVLVILQANPKGFASILIVKTLGRAATLMTFTFLLFRTHLFRILGTHIVGEAAHRHAGAVLRHVK